MKQIAYHIIWDAIESSPREAASLKARGEVMIAIQQVIATWRGTQSEAAKRLGITQPRLNDLLRGRIDKFSLDALMNLADGAGLKVKIKVMKAAA